MTSKRNRRTKPPAQPAAQAVAKASVIPTEIVPGVTVGVPMRLSAPLISGTAPIIGAAAIGGSTCTLR